MGRAQHCTSEERRHSKVLSREKSYKFITDALGRSKTVVFNALKPQKVMERCGVVRN